MKYYHYTKGGHLETILNCGYLKLCRMGTCKNEKKAVNLTTSDEWEPTVDCIVPVSTMGGAIRFVIGDTINPISWAKYRWVGKISPEIYDKLNRSARKHGSDISKWFVTFNAIHRKHWLAVEMLQDDKWVNVFEQDKFEQYKKLENYGSND